MEMTRQKIRKYAFEGPKVGGHARNNLMPRLGGLEVGLEGHERLGIQHPTIEA
jgi:hypothetical protein